MKMRYIKKIGIGLLFFNLVFSINVLNIKADEIKSTQENNMNTEEIDRSVEENNQSNSWRYQDLETGFRLRKKLMDKRILYLGVKWMVIL